MSVFNLLTNEDKIKIIDYINYYGPRRSWVIGPKYEDIDTILSEWDKQKSQDLLRLFGGERLILNRPYSYTMSDSCIIRNFEEALEDTETLRIYDDLLERFKNIITKILAKDPGYGIGTFYKLTSALFNIKTLSLNRYNYINIKLDLDGEIFKIYKGMKPLKIIHKFIEKYGNEADEASYENFRLLHSQLLNQIHLDGTLSLSIHPLDYMTMSDNGGNWTSCMRWMRNDDFEDSNPGDYRMGTVECLNSPYIIVAYLHNKEKPITFDNSNITWNRKKWRELFIVQDGIISEIKGYPYKDENLTNTVLMWLKELAENNLGWTYDDIEVDATKPYLLAEELYHFEYITSDFMYNDCEGTERPILCRVNPEKLSNYEHRKQKKLHTYNCSNSNLPYVNIYYGGIATCMKCGGRIRYSSNKTSSVFCSYCEATYICPCCGEEIESNDLIYVEAFDGPICESCYEYECGYDDLNETTEYYASLVTIYFRADEDEEKSDSYSANYITTLNPREYKNDAYESIFNDYPKQRTLSYREWIPEYYVTPSMFHNPAEIEELFGV